MHIGQPEVAAELRAAFVAGQVPRINDLSEQLEDLNREDQPELDDAVGISDQARTNTPGMLHDRTGRGAVAVHGGFDANRMARYIAAYGKDFPDPWLLMYKTMRLDGKTKKQSPEEWKETREFVIKEVSWQVAGLDLEKQQGIAEHAAALLDRAYALSDAQVAKQAAKLIEQIHIIGSNKGKAVRWPSPMDVLKNVVDQDLAELLSNPRLLPAIDAREQYLRKAGIMQ
jgi:hypothetical protein